MLLIKIDQWSRNWMRFKHKGIQKSLTHAILDLKWQHNVFYLEKHCYFFMLFVRQSAFSIVSSVTNMFTSFTSFLNVQDIDIVIQSSEKLRTSLYLSELCFENI